MIRVIKEIDYTYYHLYIRSRSVRVKVVQSLTEILTKNDKIFLAATKSEVVFVDFSLRMKSYRSAATITFLLPKG